MTTDLLGDAAKLCPAVNLNILTLALPASPLSPLSPLIPGSPLSPLSPFVPGSPLSPLSPFSPGSPSPPRSPGMPISPWGPGGPSGSSPQDQWRENTRVKISICRILGMKRVFVFMVFLCWVNDRLIRFWRYIRKGLALLLFRRGNLPVVKVQGLLCMAELWRGNI